MPPMPLRKMMGVDLTAIPTIGPGTALVIASEIGPDFSTFPRLRRRSHERQGAARLCGRFSARFSGGRCGAGAGFAPAERGLCN